MGESGWEARMAAKAAERRRVTEQAEREQQDRELAAYAAALPPCPCPYDPCPMPPTADDDWWAWSHREHFAQWRRTGRCPACDQPLTPAEMREHDCPNAILLAAVG